MMSFFDCCDPYILPCSCSPTHLQILQNYIPEESGGAQGASPKQDKGNTARSKHDIELYIHRRRCRIIIIITLSLILSTLQYSWNAAPYQSWISHLLNQDRHLSCSVDCNLSARWPALQQQWTQLEVVPLLAKTYIQRSNVGTVTLSSDIHVLDSKNKFLTTITHFYNILLQMLALLTLSYLLILMSLMVSRPLYYLRFICQTSHSLSGMYSFNNTHDQYWVARKPAR